MRFRRIFNLIQISENVCGIYVIRLQKNMK